jgi:DNA-directed RNA polymerase subunit M/transcription elongation factor TFIIS
MALQKLVGDWLDYRLGDGVAEQQQPVTYVPSPELVERNRVRQLLEQAIAAGWHADVTLGVSAHDVALEIESTLFKLYYFSQEAIYYSKVRALCDNLARNAAYLLTHYDAELLCYFPSDVLASGTLLDQWRAKQRHVLLQKLQPERRQKKGIFECPKCHSTNTDYYTLQTRSADEPATIFVECLSCNKNFRR